MKVDNNHTILNPRSSVNYSKNVLILLLILLGSILMPGWLMAQQSTFTSANEAANKLYEIVVNKDSAAVKSLFGTEKAHLLPLEEIEPQDRELFIKAWKKSHKLVSATENKTFIEIGSNGWTFPIPVSKNQQGWFFDTVAGAEIMHARLIGRNELATMQSVLAYYDAQKEYAQQDRNNDGILEYAQKFISTSGNKDGLYWEVKSGQALSPLGSIFATNTPERAYNGYFYKILTAQGKHARDGAYSYLTGTHMKSGFGLIAWPAEYGKSGVISFIISNDGIIYEKNLGVDSQQQAQKISQYDPDISWIKTDIQK